MSIIDEFYSFKFLIKTGNKDKNCKKSKIMITKINEIKTVILAAIFIFGHENSKHRTEHIEMK